MCVTRRPDTKISTYWAEGKKSITHIISAILVTPALLTVIASCSIKASPNINIFDAITSEKIDVVAQHMETGTKIEQFIPSGFPWKGASPLHLAP